MDGAPFGCSNDNHFGTAPHRAKCRAGAVHTIKANEYRRFSALNPAERGGNPSAKTVGLRPAMVREQAV
jgi:hypothetical protein